MSDIEHLNAAVIFFAIAGLTWFFYGPWRQFVIDLGRQNLFEIRDDLFTMAARGQVKFDDPVYQSVRSRINGLIRFCDSFSVLLLLSENNNRIKTHTPKLLDQIRSMQNRDVAYEIERKLMQAYLVFMTTLICRSGWAMLITILMAPVFLISELLKGVRHLNKMTSGVYSRLDSVTSIESAALT